MSEITWTVSQGGIEGKLPYVSTWAHFNKLPEEEKAKIFNNIRATLITMKLMEEK